MTNKSTRQPGESRHHIVETLAKQLLRGEGLRETVPTSDGTARRKGGKATAMRILGAALQVLLDTKTDQFSLRAVADKAGVKLANVQYYYGSRDELLNALFSVVGQAYRQAYAESMGDTPGSPVDQLTRALKVQISDARHHTTRKFFIRLWLLLEQMSGFSGEGLKRLYRFDISVLQELVLQTDKTLTPGEAETRATIIAAMIEGSLVVAPAEHSDSATFEQQMLNACLQIAIPNPDFRDS